MFRFILAAAAALFFAGCASPVTQTPGGHAQPRALAAADRSIIRIESANLPGYALRHFNGAVQVDTVVDPYQDAQFRIVPGLASPSGVSLESVNFPGQYLRHRNGLVYREAPDGGAVFNADATWYQRPGLSDASLVSLESYNFPGEYLRHQNFAVKRTPVSTALDRADATFKLWNFDWSWVKGAVFVPSNATNQVQQWDQYDPAVNDRELAMTAAAGFNLVRVYLHNLVWENNSTRLLANLEDFLTRADRSGLKTELIFFDDCWNPNPVLGNYPAPVFGVHNSRWVQGPGNAVKENYAANQARLQAYVQGVVNAHKSDSRIAFWEIYNEPGNSMSGVYMTVTNQIMKDARTWIKNTGTTIPVTSCGDFDNVNGANAANATSDFFTYHCYDGAYSGPRGKNVLVTEGMNRQSQSVPGMVQNFTAQGTGFILWEAMNGRDNCRYPWGNTTVEPTVPFHPVLYPDGHPWAVADLQALRGDNLANAALFDVTYYKDAGFSVLAKSSVTPRIDFDLGNEFGTGSPDASAGIGTDNFSIRWTGSVQTGAAGTYSFQADGDNVVRVVIGGVTVVNKTGGARATVTGSLNLAANTAYSLRVEYASATGDASLHLRWAAPGQGYQVLTGRRSAGTSATARFESRNYPGFFIRHADSRLRIDNNFANSPLADSQWIVRPGLADAAGVSLESVNYPGQFLRHRSGEAWIDPNDGSALFAADATWYRRAGLADASGVSFESSNGAGQYLRHSNYLLYRQGVSTAVDRADATFFQR